MAGDAAARFRACREPGRLLVESFPHDGREHLCVYGFAGRNAQQTLGLLLTKRMEAAGLAPLGFVATDYATLIWGLEPVADAAPLFDLQELRDGLEGWLAGNAVMKRTFRTVAIIAGLIERSHQGRRKSGRQATFSSDILYDTLHRYDPDHLLLQITRDEAMRGLDRLLAGSRICWRASRGALTCPSGPRLPAGRADVSGTGQGAGRRRGPRTSGRRCRQGPVARGGLGMTGARKAR